MHRVLDSVVPDGKSIWRQGLDTAGEIDVAVIEIERSALPETTVYRAFTPKHLCGPLNQVEVGISLLVVGMDQDVGGATGFGLQG